MKTILERPLIGKVLVLPRSSAAEFKYEEPWCCISIASTAGELPTIDTNNRIALLQLTFEDLDAIPGAAWAAAFPQKAGNVFKEEHAEKILDFVCENWDKTNLLMAHCYAGMSRSAAVGKAIASIMQPRFEADYKFYPMCNKLVYETIMRVYQEKFVAT
ncbi:MAG: hypothetical protein M0R80_00875 [Proteobacteria bacterium]|jgi:predicted protein tyrosine phosphatase|nr:hypothetical protein [Pseudomonadota bacterium]